VRRTLLFCFEPIWFQKFRRCRIKNAKTYSSLGTFAGKRPNSTLLCRHASRIGSPPIAGSFISIGNAPGARLSRAAHEMSQDEEERPWRAALIGANFGFDPTQRACVPFGKLAAHLLHPESLRKNRRRDSTTISLPTCLTLRSAAQRSVSKGGNAHDVAKLPCCQHRCQVLRVAILRDAPLRYAPQDEGCAVTDTGREYPSSG